MAKLVVGVIRMSQDPDYRVGLTDNRLVENPDGTRDPRNLYTSEAVFMSGPDTFKVTAMYPAGGNPGTCKIERTTTGKEGLKPEVIEMNLPWELATAPAGADTAALTEIALAHGSYIKVGNSRYDDDGPKDRRELTDYILDARADEVRTYKLVDSARTDSKLSMVEQVGLAEKSVLDMLTAFNQAKTTLALQRQQDKLADLFPKK